MREEKKKLLAKVAYLYYIEGKTQNEIAKELSIYRTTVSRMLKQAQDSGIVQIEIKGADTRLLQLEQYVKEKYQLKDIEIIPTDPEDTQSDLADKLSEAAGFLIKRYLEPNMVVGLAWGQAVGDAISQIESKKVANTVFLPIVGGPSHVNVKYHVNTLVYEMARKFQGKSIFVNATVVQESKMLQEGIFNSRYFAEIREYWQKLDMVIVGVGGALREKTSQWRDLLSKEDYEALQLREAAGDCCCRFFDQDGKVLKGDLYDRTIGLELSSLSKVPRSIAIASGKNKSQAILALLRKKYVNTLITDEETMLTILRLDKDATFLEMNK